MTLDILMTIVTLATVGTVAYMVWRIKHHR
jgi:hypothetical protein